MEREPNHIDDHFFRRLYDAELTPPAFVWQNIERDLRKRRRRKFFLWFFALGITGTALWALAGRNEKDQLPATLKEETIVAGKEKVENAPAGVTTPNIADEHSAPLNIEPRTESGSAIPGPRKAKDPKIITESAAKSGYSFFTAPSEHSIISTNDPNTVVAGNTVQRQDIEPEAHLSAISPLNASDIEPLAFARNNTFPKVKSFIRKKKDPKYCYDFAQNPNVLLFDVYAGPSFSGRKLTAADPSFGQYRQQRLDTEQPDLAFNAGLRGSLLLSRHFLLRTGAHYEQMTDVFEYIDPNYVKYLVEITHTVVDNKPVTIIDTVGVEYGENYVRTYNRYGLLDIPLEAGVEFRRGRIGLSINAGISLNVLFWKRGTILSAAGKPQEFTPGEAAATEVFRPRTGFSTGGSAQIFFHLKPRLRLFAEPYFRKILKPITLDDQPVEQRYRMFGLKVGMTKILD